MSLLGHDDAIFIQVRGYNGSILPASIFYCFETCKMPLPYQANHSRHSKQQKMGLGECEIVLIFRAKHENEVEAQRLCRRHCTGYKNSDYRKQQVVLK